MSLCFRLLLWCHLRCGAEIHHCRVVPERDPDMTAVRAVRLCVAPADWASISQRWWIRSGFTGMPCCKVSQAAFVTYRRAGRLSQLLFDLWEAVLVFAGVYRALGAEIAASALVPGAALAALPHMRSHLEGAELVFGKTGRVVFLDKVRRSAHRHALTAGAWSQEMRSWRALPRCGRERGPRHDRSALLDRPLTPFGFFALYAAYTLCPSCGLRRVRRPFAWPVLASLRDPLAFVQEPLGCGTGHMASGTHRPCRMHSDPRVEYAVPDLLATSPIPGSDRLRWRHWPRYNEVRGVFEERVTEENRWWPTFLDFSYKERRAMQVICVFCDSRQELCLCSCVVGFRLSSVDPWFARSVDPLSCARVNDSRCPEVRLGSCV